MIGHIRDASLERRSISPRFAPILRDAQSLDLLFMRRGEISHSTRNAFGFSLSLSLSIRLAFPWLLIWESEHTYGRERMVSHSYTPVIRAWHVWDRSYTCPRRVRKIPTLGCNSSSSGNLVASQNTSAAQILSRSDASLTRRCVV